MALKEFCKTLHQYAEKLEQEVRIDINDFHNHIFGKKMDETKLALERAKDYHYKEVMDSVSEILKQVKIIIFHQDKIEWLKNENNFTSNDMRRFSYVKRQVYAFSNPDQNLSKSEQNLSVLTKTKREKRRTLSVASIVSLEDWEKYMDKKQKGENNSNGGETEGTVPKRTLSNARARKKFVSSTLGGFLDDEKTKLGSLDSIIEHSNDSDGTMHNNQEEIANRWSMANSNTQNKNGSVIDLVECMSNVNTKDGYIKNAIEETFMERDHEAIRQSLREKEPEEAEKTKPRIIDVVYKKRLH